MHPPPFDQLFSPQILTRAYPYANANHIQITHKDKGTIQALVTGTQPYKVQMVWKDNEYTQLSCTCPYDQGLCKHLAAVLLWFIDQEVENMIASSAKASKRDAPK